MTTRPTRGKSAPPPGLTFGLTAAGDEAAPRNPDHLADAAHPLPRGPRPMASPAAGPEDFAAYAAPTGRRGWNAPAGDLGAPQAPRAPLPRPDAAAPLLEAVRMLATPAASPACEWAPDYLDAMASALEVETRPPGPPPSDLPFEEVRQSGRLAAALMLADGPRALLAWARGEGPDDVARDVFARCGRPRTLAAFLGALDATAGPAPHDVEDVAEDVAAVAGRLAGDVRRAIVRITETYTLDGAPKVATGPATAHPSSILAAALRGDVGAAVRGVLELAAGAELHNRTDAIRAIADSIDAAPGPREVRR